MKLKRFRQFLLEAASASDFKNTFDLDGVWWEKWRKVHGEEYDIRDNTFQNTKEVLEKGSEKIIFIFDTERNKVFSNKDLDFFTT